MFAGYKDQYDDAAEEEKEEIINTLFKKVKKGIKPPVNDNEGELPETMCCVWNFEESSLR